MNSCDAGFRPVFTRGLQTYAPLSRHRLLSYFTGGGRETAPTPDPRAPVKPLRPLRARRYGPGTLASITRARAGLVVSDRPILHECHIFGTHGSDGITGSPCTRDVP